MFSAVIIARGKRKVKHLFVFYAGNFWKKGLLQRKKYAIIEESAREGTPLGVGGYARRTRGMEKNIAGNAGENIDNAENVWYNLFVMFYYDKCLLRGIFPYKGEKKEKNNAFV